MPTKQNHAQIDALRQEIARLEGLAPQGGRETVSSGWSDLDRILPGRGFRTGTLVEWLFAGDGTGAATLALWVARQAGRQGGGVIVLDRSREFYPPAAVRLGIAAAQLIVIHPGGKADHHWALDQSLRCPAVAAVVAWPDAVEGKLDGRTFRRLQLAVEEGGGLGLLIRPESVRDEPSWADVRVLVEPLPRGSPYGRKRRLKVLLLRCRGAAVVRPIELEIDDDASPVPVV
jgi:hypothetical protein